MTLPNIQINFLSQFIFIAFLISFRCCYEFKYFFSKEWKKTISFRRHLKTFWIRSNEFICEINIDQWSHLLINLNANNNHMRSKFVCCFFFETVSLLNCCFIETKKYKLFYKRFIWLSSSLREKKFISF